MTVKVEQIRISGTGGLTLVADSAGPVDGQPVILLHGGGQTRHSWSRAVERLLAEGFQVINFDARGHGESDWSPTGAYALSDRAADLATVTADLNAPFILVGASLGAAGAQEAIYCLLMMKHGFAAESAHIENLDPEFEGMPILRERHDGELKHVMSNSFGFGGTNGTLILSKV